MSHRQSAQQYEQYRKGRLAQIELEKKEEFEESLRNSVKRTIPSNSALFGASKNIFEQDLTKDTANLVSLNKRKHIMKEKILNFVVLTRIALGIMLTCFAYVATFIAYNTEGYIMCGLPSITFIAMFILIGEEKQ